VRRDFQGCQQKIPRVKRRCGGAKTRLVRHPASIRAFCGRDVAPRADLVLLFQLTRAFVDGTIRPEMAQQSTELLVLFRLFLVILLPIVPAYLLFKALPSSANLSGPLQGMELKLGGAFAGYFAIVVLVLFEWNKIFPPPNYDVWEVTGQINYDTSSREPLAFDDIRMAPPSLELTGGGTFKVYFYTMPGPKGTFDFPKLTLGHKGFKSITVDLKPPVSDYEKSQEDRDEDNHFIALKPLNLEKGLVSPYEGVGEPPKPVGANSEGAAAPVAPKD
jgi:hypothetical protein